MNLANKLTILRIVLIPVFMITLYYYGDSYVPAILFIVASLTDLLDGYIARKYDMITDFGKFLDPIADKLLVLSAMIYFTEVGRMQASLTFTIVAREIIVSALRIVAANENIVLAASKLGKIKTAVTMVTIIFMLIFRQYLIVETTLVYITVAITCISGIDYLVKNAKVFKGKM